MTTERQISRGRFHLHSIEELFELPPPQWLVDGVMETGVLAVLYGPPGTGKTFVALDWALSIATGSEWLGRPTRCGPVVYVAAEGGRSVQKRVRAWLRHRELNPPVDGYFVLEPVQLRNVEDWDALRRQIDRRNLQPALIVVDTLARCFVGGEENSAKDVGEFIEACRWLEESTGAAVLVVHHTGKGGDTERGSSALRAAADVMVEISRTSQGSLEIANTKQKDEEEFATIRVRLQSIEVGRDDMTGRDLTSCVVIDAGPPEPRGRLLPSGAAHALEVLRRFGQGAAASRDWRNATNQPERTFHRSRDILLQTGLVREVRNRPSWYEVVDADRTCIASPCAPRATAATATTP